MDIVSARELVLAEFSAEEYDHFGKVAFRVKAKKPGGKAGRTFMTLWPLEGHAVLMLDRDRQAELLDHPGGAFERHPTKWGLNGATIMKLDSVNATTFRAAVTTAFDHARRPA